MVKNATIIFLFAIAILFHGCMGKNFEQMGNSLLVLEKTTVKEIKDSLGKPFVEQSLMKNNEKITYIVYYYMNEMGRGDGPNTVPKRSQTFYFSEGKLIGHFYSSSLKEDSTDFDKEKANEIKKGVSSEKDVLSIFGAPTGESIYPLTDTKGDRIILYKYEKPVLKGSMIYSFDKSLKFVLDPNGIVKDINYQEQKPDM